MPISTITPLSLTASVNLSILRYALNDLEQNHNFHISDGYWCCRACSISDAWECGIGKSYVFWHEQNEDEVHESSNFEMPLYFGISKKSAKREEIVETAITIISVLEKYKLSAKWSCDIREAIIVKLDEHKPYQGEYFLWNDDTHDYEANDPEDDMEKQEDHDFQWLYLWVKGLTKNELSEMNYGCIEPQFDYEPQNTFQIVLTIEDGESTRSTFMQLPEEVKNNCTHFQRTTKVGCISSPIEDIHEINEMSLLALHKYLWLNLFACKDTYQKSVIFNSSFTNNNLDKTKNFLLDLS